ncbi:MAG TPA: secretin N-terminal domain-containing protein [Verrucomicrobiae bacterium]|nr:secretin N-terminal domain-containing protein [Verrucomicrobiae bacterium]
MKTFLLTLALSSLTIGARAADTGTFAPLPADTSRDTNRGAQLQQALQNAINGKPTPALSTAQTNAPAASINVLMPAAVPVPVPVPVPAPGTRNVLTPSSGPTSTPIRPAVGLPAPGSPAPIPGQPRTATEATAAPVPAASSTNMPPDETLPAGTINFPATDLNQVLQIYAELVGRTVLRPTSLPAPTITLKTQTPLTRREAIQAFDAVLALNGIAVVNVGDKFVKVVPTAQAGQIGAPFNKEKPEQLPDMGQFVTHVVQTTYVKPTELVPVLTPFASPGLANGILPIDASQILVLRDYSENVKRMLEMVKKIDISVPSEFISEVIPIKYALASDIASALNSLSTGGGATTVGTSAGGAGGTRGAGYGRSGSGLGRTGLGTGFPGSTGFGASPYGGTTTPQAATQPGGAANSFSDRLRNIINRASVSGEIQVLGQTKIIADERTNALLIYASRDDMKIIKDIVAKLDVVLAQVLIEAVIIEVSLNTSSTLGVSYLENKPHGIGNSFLGQGAINNNSFVSPGSFSLLNGATNAAGNLPSGFSYLASLGNNDLDVAVQALASDAHARILQRPRIQTSHAVPATLFVGESRPYPQGSYYGGGAFGGYSTIQQLQIGVSLEVTPLINPDGLVVMDIHQKIDSFKGNVTIQGVGDVPVTSSKDATAKVAVRDRDTIMLGGLIETDKNSNNSGVPLLKDIPLLGYLFRSSEKDETRSELIVLIRPTVLPTPEVAALTARAEKDKLPEVRRMENEVQAEENARLHKFQREQGQDRN